MAAGPYTTCKHHGLTNDVLVLIMLEGGGHMSYYFAMIGSCMLLRLSRIIGKLATGNSRVGLSRCELCLETIELMIIGKKLE